MERKWLKTLRKMKNLTLEDVGKKLGVSKATIQRYESGNIDIPYERICQLAELYNVEPNYLFPDYSSDKENADNEYDVKKAMELYQLYKKAIPQIQVAVENLLKSTPPTP